MAKET
jgi:hypothetical protein